MYFIAAPSSSSSVKSAKSHLELLSLAGKEHPADPWSWRRIGRSDLRSRKYNFRATRCKRVGRPPASRGVEPPGRSDSIQGQELPFWLGTRLECDRLVHSDRRRFVETRRYIAC